MIEVLHVYHIFQHFRHDPTDFRSLTSDGFFHDPVNAKCENRRESRQPCPTPVLYFNSSLRFVPQMSLSETGHKMHYTFSRVSQFSIDIRKTTGQKESRASPRMLYGSLASEAN